jgi:hypothetical protein
LTIRYGICYIKFNSNETTENYKGGNEMTVIGSINLKVIVPVDGESEELSLLQANYNVNPDRMVAWELYGIDCKGNRVKVDVCDCDKVDLDEVI